MDPQDKPEAPTETETFADPTGEPESVVQSGNADPDPNLVSENISEQPSTTLVAPPPISAAHGSEEEVDEFSDGESQQSKDTRENPPHEAQGAWDPFAPIKTATNDLLPTDQQVAAVLMPGEELPPRTIEQSQSPIDYSLDSDNPPDNNDDNSPGDLERGIKEKMSKEDAPNTKLATRVSPFTVYIVSALVSIPVIALICYFGFFHKHENS